jgi:hypothetical protein
MSGYTKSSHSFSATYAERRTHRDLRSRTTLKLAGSVLPKETLEGMSELRTDEGYAVNLLEKGVYQTVETGVTLTSNDPKAF